MIMKNLIGTSVGAVCAPAYLNGLTFSSFNKFSME